MNQSRSLPYWRLSSFYFAYFAALGAMLPYWSLYLKSIEFDAKAIGQLTAILVASKIIAPNVWGWLADHYGRRMLIIQIGSVIALIAFAGAFFTTGFWGLAFVLLLFGFFWNATLAQFEVTTLNYLGESHHGYSKIRVWGSIGFIVTVWLLGVLFEKIEIRYLIHIIFFIMALILIASLLVSDSQAAEHHAEHRSIVTTLLQPKVIGLILACILMQASHGPYYTFYTIYLEQHDYSLGFIGEMWALGVIAEVVIFIFMFRLINRFSIKKLFLASMLITSVRWYLIAYYVDSTFLIVFAQLLHAASFGLYHVCAISLFHENFTGPIQGRGQAIYSSMSYGAGITLGSFLSGYAWDSLGSTITFLSASILCLVAAMIVWIWVESIADNVDHEVTNPGMIE